MRTRRPGMFVDQRDGGDCRSLIGARLRARVEMRRLIA